jgi:hypothetical protein
MSWSILAVLSKALYLQSDAGHIVCIMGPEAEDGPLTLHVSKLPAYFDANARFSLSALGIEWNLARSWKASPPDHMGGKGEQEMAARGANRILLEHCASHSPAKEFAGGTPRLQRLARMEIEERSARLARALKQRDPTRICDAVINLLGLGQGLTPSGDDVVMGALAMLVWRARLGDFPVAVIDSLTQAINREAPKHTNVISARLLDYACQGVLYAPAMELGAALLAGASHVIAAPAHRLLAMGGSSGAELARGLLVGLESTWQ